MAKMWTKEPVSLVVYNPNFFFKICDGIRCVDNSFLPFWVMIINIWCGELEMLGFVQVGNVLLCNQWYIDMQNGSHEVNLCQKQFNQFYTLCVQLITFFLLIMKASIIDSHLSNQKVHASEKLKISLFCFWLCCTNHFVQIKCKQNWLGSSSIAHNTKVDYT